MQTGQATYISLVSILFMFASMATCFAADIPSKYFRHTPGADTAIVFVHGIFGDGQATWTNGKAYWPTMLISDPVFKDADIFVYSYPTGLWAALSIDELAENMRLQLAANNVVEHKHLVFLSHSMGGLIARAYLLRYQDIAKRTALMYFYSTPTTGSQIAALASLLLRNPQLGQMRPMDSEGYLANELRSWLAADLHIPAYCAYETKPTYGVLVVTLQSASALCNKRLDPIDADHLTIARPKDQFATSYLAFQVAYKNELLGSAKLGKEIVTQEQSRDTAQFIASIDFAALQREIDIPTEYFIKLVMPPAGNPVEMRQEMDKKINDILGVVRRAGYGIANGVYDEGRVTQVICPYAVPLNRNLQKFYSAANDNTYSLERELPRLFQDCEQIGAKNSTAR